MIFISLATFVFGKKKDKTVQVVIPQQENRLSEDDMLRYRYFYLEAIRQNEAENYPEAYDLYRHCLQINPYAAEVHYSIAPYESAFGRDSLALSHLETALKLDPDNDEFAEKLAQYYLSNENDVAPTDPESYIMKAAGVYESLSQRFPDRTEYLSVLAKIYQYQKDYSKVLSTFNRLEMLEGQSEDLTLTKMQVYSNMGDEKGAYKELQRLVKSHPNDLNYKVMMGNWLLSNGKKDEAQKTFLAVLKDEPNHAQAQMSLMDYYRSVGNTEESDKLMNAMLDNPRTDTQTRMTLMRQMIEDSEEAGGDSTNVLNMFNRMLSYPQTGSEMAEMRVAYMNMKKMPVDTIKAALDKVLQISPENSQARLQLLDILWRDTIDAKVIAECEKAIAYNPDEMALYYYLGLAKYLNSDDKGALDAFQRGVSHIQTETPTDICAKTYMLMGDILHQMNRPESAYAAYDSCLVYNPDEISCLNNYAYYLSEEDKDLKRAEQMSYKTIKAEPENGTYLDTYAWIMYKQGRYEEARIYIDQVMKVDTANVSGVLLDHAGDIYIKLNLKDEAIDFWQKALKDGVDNADDVKKKISNAKK